MTIDVDRLRSEIEVDPSRAIAGLKAYDTALSAATRDRDTDLDLDLSSALFSLQEFEGAADLATRDRTMNVDVDRDGNLGRAAGALGSIASMATSAGEALASAAGSGGGFGSVVSSAFGMAGKGGAMLLGTVAGIGQAFAGLALGAVVIGSVLPGAFAAAAAGAGILLAALAPLVGLLGGLPVLIGGLGLAAGALMGGLASVVGGVSAYKQASEGASAASEDLTAKQQALASAMHQVAMAERAVADARKDMAEAPHLAAEAIEDAHFSAAQAALNEKKAILSLQEAQKNLTAAQNEAARSSLKITQQTDEFTGKVYDVATSANDASDGMLAQRNAALALQQAQLDVATAKDANDDAQRNLNEAERKGIKNSDIMVDARRRLADAEWSLKQAHQSAANAQKALNKSMTSGTAATQAWTKAQKNLSAEGVDFVKFLADDFMPGLSDIGKGIQEELLPGLKGGLTILMGDFDEIGNELSTVGGLIGDTFEEFMQFWNTPAQRSLLGGMFENLNDSIEAGLDLLRPFSRVLVHITDAAAPMFTRVLEGIGGWLDDIADKWDTKGGKNGLVQFFDDAAYFGGLWWDVLKGVWGVLEPIINAGKPLAAKWLKGLAGDLEDMGDYLSSRKGQKMLTQFFEDAVPALKQTWKFITGIADVLFNSSEGGTDSGFYKFMKSLNDDLVPTLKDFFENVDGSDIATNVVGIFEAGVDFMNALNDSGALKALELLGDTLVLLSKTATPYNDVVAPDYDNPNMTPKEEDFTSWKKFTGDLETIWQGTFGSMEVLMHVTLDRMRDNWNAYWDDVGDIFSGIGDDAKGTWEDMTTALKEERDIWKERFTSFRDWLGDLSWDGMFDGLADAFYNVIEWIADLWNKTIGGLEVHKPGANWKIPEINIDGIGDAPSTPGTPGGDPNAPAQPTPGDRGGNTGTGLGAVGDRVVINQTFNEKVDPHHLSRELAWSLG